MAPEGLKDRGEVVPRQDCPGGNGGDALEEHRRRAQPLHLDRGQAGHVREIGVGRMKRQGGAAGPQAGRKIPGLQKPRGHFRQRRGILTHPALQSSTQTS